MFRSHRERDERLRQELELHLELATEANVRRGMTPGEARRAARIALGAATISGMKRAISFGARP